MLFSIAAEKASPEYDILPEGAEEGCIGAPATAEVDVPELLPVGTFVVLDTVIVEVRIVDVEKRVVVVVLCANTDPVRRKRQSAARAHSETQRIVLDHRSKECKVDSVCQGDRCAVRDQKRH